MCTSLALHVRRQLFNELYVWAIPMWCTIEQRHIVLRRSAINGITKIEKRVIEINFAKSFDLDGVRRRCHMI